MSDKQAGSNREQHTTDDYQFAERSHREVEKEVTDNVVLVRGICKDVMPFYVSGHPPSGVPINLISCQISPNSALIQSADAFVSTLPAQFHKGYTFPSEFLYNESLELCRDLRKCAVSSDKKQFLDCIRELKELNDLIKRGRMNIKNLNLIEFRRALYIHFDKIINFFSDFSNYFSEIENEFSSPDEDTLAKGNLAYNQPNSSVAELTKSITEIRKQQNVIEEKIDEVDWFVSDGHERGILRSDKKLATDVRAKMASIAVEKIKNSPCKSLSHRQAVRETTAEFKGRPGAYSAQEEEAFRKRVDRDCTELGLTG